MTVTDLLARVNSHESHPTGSPTFTVLHVVAQAGLAWMNSTDCLRGYIYGQPFIATVGTDRPAFTDIPIEFHSAGRENKISALYELLIFSCIAAMERSLRAIFLPNWAKASSSTKRGEARFILLSLLK
jgi:hypothetical protein